MLGCGAAPSWRPSSRARWRMLTFLQKQAIGFEDLPPGLREKAETERRRHIDRIGDSLAQVSWRQHGREHNQTGKLSKEVEGSVSIYAA